MVIKKSDIKRLKNFEIRLNKKLGTSKSLLKTHLLFYDRLYRSYKKPSDKFIPPNIERRKFFEKSKSGRKILSKKYHEKLIKKRIKDAKELSKIHEVKY